MRNIAQLWETNAIYSKEKCSHSCVWHLASVKDLREKICEYLYILLQLSFTPTYATCKASKFSYALQMYNLWIRRFPHSYENEKENLNNFYV